MLMIISSANVVSVLAASVGNRVYRLGQLTQRPYCLDVAGKLNWYRPYRDKCGSTPGVRTEIPYQSLEMPLTTQDFRMAGNQ
jgi:Tfp pilus assembly protein PilZ